MTDFRLHLDDAEAPPRLLTGPEEIEYIKQYEAACRNYATDELQQLVNSEFANSILLAVQQQRVEFRLRVLRRVLAERKQ